VRDHACRQRLDLILQRELNDAAAWQLQPDGSYSRPASVPMPGSVAQVAAVSDVDSWREAVAG
jgi:hypothetical protein